MYRGKKVTEPLPKVRGTDLYDASLTDLASAWETVGKARNEFRKIDQRLGEAQRLHRSEGLNATGEASIRDFSTFSLGTNQTNICTGSLSGQTKSCQFPSGATVDNLGWSKHVRSQKSNILDPRTISWLGGKYPDHPNMQPDRPVSSKNGLARNNAQQDLQNHDPEFGNLDVRGVSPKRVDFSNQLEMRKINPDGTYTDSYALGATTNTYGHGNVDLDPSYMDVKSDFLLSHDPHSQSQSRLTDSRALRETDIRFLNDQHFPHTDPYDVRWNKVASRLTHVDVKVPSASNYRYTSRQPLNIVDQPALSSNSDVRQDGYSSATSEGSEGGNGKRMTKHLKDFDRDTGALAKLNEKIRQQRLATAAKNVKEPPERQNSPVAADPAPGIAMGGNDVTRRLHNNADPVETIGAMPVWEADRFTAAVTRKVATGPPAPAYKGFNEAEARYKLVKHVDSSKKPNRKKTHKLNLQERKSDEKAGRLRDTKRVDKPRKRVIASRDKPAKPIKAKDVITTSSWRTGQEAILQTLGPAKSPRTSRMTGGKSSSDADRDRKVSKTEKASHRPEPVGGAEQLNSDVPGALSEEARKVLNDLNIQQPGLEADKISGITKETELDKPKKPAVKRKAPKPQEPEKQQPASKTRHYDADSVRQYIAKQKEERLKKKRAEEEAQRRMEEEKRKQLEELYRKQRPSSRSSKQRLSTAVPKPRTVAYEETNNRRPFSEDKIRLLLGTESDKDNKLEVDMSDSSSTLTNEDSIGDSTPVSTPRGDQPDRANEIRTSKSNYGTTEVDVDTVMGQNSLYSTLAHDAHGQRGVLSGETRVHPTIPTSTNPATELGLFSESGKYRTRIERIQAIRDTAKSLQNRLQAEAQLLGEPGTIQQAVSFPGAAVPPASSSCGATPLTGPALRLTDDKREVTRHDRIAGVNDDFTVFSANLPGVQSLSSHLHRVEQSKAEDAAATRIQSAYRGQAVRNTLAWKLPSGKNVGAKIRAAGGPRKENYEDSAGESSSFSDITITDDSEVESLSSPKQIGAGLLGRDYHPGDRYRQELLEEGRQDYVSLPHTRYHQPAGICWDKPEPDPYSTLSVFTRKYQQSKRERLEPSGVQAKVPAISDLKSECITATSGRAEILRHVNALPSHEADGLGRHDAEEFQTAFPERKTSNEDFLNDEKRKEVTVFQPSQNRADATTGRTTGDIPRHYDIRSGLVSASFHPTLEDGDKEEDVTLDGDVSYTQSFDSDNDPVKKTQGIRSESVAKDTAVGEDVRSGHPIHLEESLESDVSSSVDESLQSLSRMHKTSSASKVAEDTSSAHLPPRFSPNALERKMVAGLNLLESMEESMRQLTGVERSRAISMAQQETVSLAQILKSRQVHAMEMKELQLKTREEFAVAGNQLEEARKKAAKAAQNAAQMITMVRGGDASQSLQQSRRKLIRSQTEVAKATAEATRYLAEARGTVGQNGQRENIANRHSKSSGRSVLSTAEERSLIGTARSVSKSSVTSGYFRSSDDYDSVTRSPGNSRPKSKSSCYSGVSGDVVTAADSHVDSSIKTESGAVEKDDLKSESIVEDLSFAKGSCDDYSMNFDESMTEDEVEEKSFRMVLPSESHRRKAKHQRTLSDVSVTSEDQSVSSVKLGDDFSSLFIGEDSFKRFTTEMVSQYMKEEELRAQHQASLLKLREKALRERTKAELAWLDQQKKRMRNKGSDDTYPQLKKRQRGIILKLEQGQAEIKRLQEANLAASKERQMILKQQQELQELRKSTENTWEKVHGGRPGRSSHLTKAYRRDEIHTEDEVNGRLENGSDAGEGVSRKDIKSDSEIYTEPKQRKTYGSKIMTKLKHVHLDERYLTAREKKLRDRRKNAEELLAWKKKLDDEEKEIFELEKKAIDVWENDDKKSTKKVSRSEKAAVTDTTDGIKEKKSGKGKEVEKREGSLPEKESHGGTCRSESESSISEAVSRSEISRSQVSRSRIQGSKHISPVSKRNKGQAEGSESEGSIQEEIQSQSSSNTEETSNAKHKTGDSIHDAIQTQSVIDTYTEDSFVSTGSVPLSKKKSPLQKLRTPPGGLLFDPSRSPLSAGRPFSYKRGSESESEDSLHAETASDQSDVEGRIKALKDQLQCRKLQCERLKKQSEEQQREKRKNYEQSLRKQIEAYDNSIKQLTAQIQNEEKEPVRTGKKPQIKHPRGRDSKQKTAQEELSPNKAHPPQRSESESSRSSQSSSFEEGRDSFDSSPASATDGVLTSPSVYRKEGSSTGKKTSLLESISERSETPRYDRARRSLLGKDEKVNSKQEDSTETNNKYGQHKWPRDEEELALPIEDLPEKSETSVLPEAPIDSKPPSFEPTPLSARSELTPRQQSFNSSEILTARSEISDHISENVPSQASAESCTEERLGFKPLGVLKTDEKAVEKQEDLPAESPLLVEEDALKSARSDVSKYSSTKSVSEKSELSYSEDFSEVETGVSERGKALQSLGKQDSVLSEEEISEDLSMLSEVSEKTFSVPLLDLNKPNTNDHQKKEFEEDLIQVIKGERAVLQDENKTPLQSPRDTSVDLMLSTPDAANQILTLQDVEKKPPLPAADTSVEELELTTAAPFGNLSSDFLEKPLTQESAIGDDESLVTDSELDKVISSTAAAVEEFDSTPFSSPEHVPRPSASSAASEKLVDSITNGLITSVLKDQMSTMNEIAAKRSPSKTPPPTLPRQNLGTTLPGQETSQLSTGTSLDISPEVRPNQLPIANMQTESNMLNEAISDMITIRNKQRKHFLNQQRSESMIPDQSSPGSGLQMSSLDIVPSGEQLGEDPFSNVARPGSPLPGDKPILTKQDDLTKLDDDLIDIYGVDDQYHDDDEWFHTSSVPNKPPPPYPGTADHAAHIPFEMGGMLQIEEPQYVVPHCEEDVMQIVDSAVEVFWMHRRYGESLDNVQPPESYFTQEENGKDMDSRSRRSYKKIIFNLTGEIIREIYKEEEEEEEVALAWKKPKRKQQRYYRGLEPPTTVDVLTKLVQDTAKVILGLNGSPKLDSRLNKWGSRKKKDNVDRILVEELREEEPHWVNYDEDELAVKMRLTDSIFDSLLIQDTVQTMNKIFLKRKQRTQEPG